MYNVIERKLECIRGKYYHQMYRRNVHVSGKGPGTTVSFLYVGHLIHYDIILSTAVDSLFALAVQYYVQMGQVDTRVARAHMVFFLLCFIGGT